MLLFKYLYTGEERKMERKCGLYWLQLVFYKLAASVAAIDSHHSAASIAGKYFTRTATTPTTNSTNENFEVFINSLALCAK